MPHAITLQAAFLTGLPQHAFARGVTRATALFHPTAMAAPVNQLFSFLSQIVLFFLELFLFFSQILIFSCGKIFFSFFQKIFFFEIFYCPYLKLFFPICRNRQVIPCPAVNFILATFPQVNPSGYAVGGTCFNGYVGSASMVCALGPSWQTNTYSSSCTSEPLSLIKRANMGSEVQKKKIIN